MVAPGKEKAAGSCEAGSCEAALSERVQCLEESLEVLQCCVTDADTAAQSEDAASGLASWVQCMNQAECASALRRALSSEMWAARFLASPRPKACALSIAHVKSMIASDLYDQPHDVCLAAWPVVSINEWGVEQSRILVLSAAALWRINYDAAWSQFGSATRISLDSVVGVQRRRRGGFVLLLSHRDGRANPLAEAMRLARSARSKEAKAAPSTYERAYLAVPPGASPSCAEEVQHREQMAAAIVESIVAALEACVRIHHGKTLNPQGPQLEL